VFALLGACRSARDRFIAIAMSRRGCGVARCAGSDATTCISSPMRRAWAAWGPDRIWRDRRTINEPPTEISRFAHGIIATTALFTVRAGLLVTVMIYSGAWQIKRPAQLHGARA
jgi:hypothetical protein